MGDATFEQSSQTGQPIAGKLVPEPFANAGIGLLYPTGVPVRLREPDTHDLPGRRDQQLKMSGNMVIESLGVYLPARAVTTDEVVRGCRQPLRFPLERLSGIRSRRVADGEYAIDLAARAIEDCLAHSAHTADAIDLLICANISRYDGPEHRFVFEPATAARLQQRCGFRNALAFDISNACAGVFTALGVVEVLLKQGLIRRAMVVSGEYITHLTHTAQLEIESFMDLRLACLTLGDSGMALILEQAANDKVGFHDLEMYTLGKYHSLCVAKITDRPHGGAIMYTDPVKSSTVSIKQAVGHALHVLERRDWKPEELDTVILHQTSSTTLDGAIQEVNRVVGREVCTPQKTICNVGERGNTATTTHFVALWDQLQQGRTNAGDKILFGISGSGQTVGTALYTMDDLPARWRQPPVKKSEAPAKPQAFSMGRCVRIESVGLATADGSGHAHSQNLLRSAGRACLSRSRLRPTDIELVLHTGVYRSDYQLEPAMAAIAAGELGMNADEARERRTFAFDLTTSGTGPLYACLVAAQMIAAGKAASAMIIATEVDNNAQFWPENLLGIHETGSAFILEPTDSGEGFRSFWFQSFPDHLAGMGAYTMARNNLPVLAIERSPHLDLHYLTCLAAAVDEFLHSEGINRADIGLVLPPLRSPRFVRQLAEVLRMPLERFVLPPEAAADAFTSSLAQGVALAREMGRCPTGTRTLMLAVGAGIQVGCALYSF